MDKTPSNIVKKPSITPEEQAEVKRRMSANQVPPVRVEVPNWNTTYAPQAPTAVQQRTAQSTTTKLITPSQPTTKYDSNELTGFDIARLTAAGVDFGSTMAGLIPGANLGAAAVGAASTVATGITDAIDPDVSAFDAGKNFAINAGMDALSLIPGGKAVKGIKAGKFILKHIPKLINTIKTYGVLSSVASLPTNAPLALSAAKKAQEGNWDEITPQEWQATMNLVQTGVGAYKYGSVKYGSTKQEKVVPKTYVSEGRQKLANATALVQNTIIGAKNTLKAPAIAYKAKDTRDSQGYLPKGVNIKIKTPAFLRNFNQTRPAASESVRTQSVSSIKPKAKASNSTESTQPTAQPVASTNIEPINTPLNIYRERIPLNATNPTLKRKDNAVTTQETPNFNPTNAVIEVGGYRNTNASAEGTAHSTIRRQPTAGETGEARAYLQKQKLPFTKENMATALAAIRGSKKENGGVIVYRNGGITLHKYGTPIDEDTSPFPNKNGIYGQRLKFNPAIGVNNNSLLSTDQQVGDFINAKRQPVISTISRYSTKVPINASARLDNQSSIVPMTSNSSTPTTGGSKINVGSAIGGLTDLASLLTAKKAHNKAIEFTPNAIRPAIMQDTSNVENKIASQARLASTPQTSDALINNIQRKSVNANTSQQLADINDKKQTDYNQQLDRVTQEVNANRQGQNAVDNQNIQSENQIQNANAQVKSAQTASIMSNILARNTDAQNAKAAENTDFKKLQLSEEYRTHQSKLDSLKMQYENTTDSVEKQRLLKEYNVASQSINPIELYKKYNNREKGGVISYKKGGSLNYSEQLSLDNNKIDKGIEKEFRQTTIKYIDLATKVNTNTLNNATKLILQATRRR